ncbi:MAG: DUF2490 domain-containing protein [Chitinophagaceae bacterium]
MKLGDIKIFICLLMLCYTANAQKSNYGNWLIYFGNQAINKKWNWHNEIQYRNYDALGDMEQLLLRIGLGYNLTENNNNVLLGYAYVKSNRYITNTEDKTSNEEHRIYQQFITRQSYKGINILHRYRVEERFLQKDFKLRFRYFLSINIPFTKPAMQPNAFYLSIYNEIFLNNTSSSFDRNRVYGAIGYVVNKNVRFELGTMSQLLENNNRNQFQIVLFNNTPFSK